MRQKNRIIALGGLLGALCIISLYLAAYLPTSRLFFYIVSSVFCGIMLIESGAYGAWMLYIATSLLSVCVIPDKPRILPYILLFGFYGIIKHYIEKIKSVSAQMALKFVFFAIDASAMYVILKKIFMLQLNFGKPLWLVAFIAAVIFFIYDYAYTKFIVYYNNMLKKRLK
ncbi:MAG TPA: hypothetical protein DD426_04495 [Clostridiaceae bacterium]|nr:hypothetical protein [Clostridiaceae bacterium]